MKIDTFFAELKRRNVYKVAIAYVVGGWALSQGVSQVFPVFDVPNWVIRAIVLLIILGLPVALVLPWMFELTPEGIKRTQTADAMPAAAKPKKYVWIYVVVIGGAISIGLFFLGRYTASNSASAARTETATVPGKSIAVLPFENLSDDKNTAYFSDGITEEILNALAQIPNLKVAARRSAFQFKGNELDLRKIGQVLGVAHILEGSLQKAGDQVRINVQLVDVQNGLQAWSEKYDRKLDNVFEVEDEIAKAIASKLRVQLTGGAGQPLVVAQAWGALAVTEFLLPSYGLDSFEASLPQAESAAQRALVLDPNTPSAYVAFGLANTFRCRWSEADQAFRRALVLAPGDAEAVNQYAQFLSTVGQLEASLREIERAQQLDPLSPIIGVIHAGALAALRRDNAAEAQIKSVLAAHPEFGAAYTWAATQYIDHKMYSEAEAELRSLGKLRGQNGDAKALLARGMADPPNASQPWIAWKLLRTMPISGETRSSTHFISYHWDNVAVPWMSWKSMRSSPTALSHPGSGIAVSIRWVTNRASRRSLPNWPCPIHRLSSWSDER